MTMETLKNQATLNEEQSNKPKYITASKISELTGVSVKKLYRWKRQGYLTSVGKDSKGNVLYTQEQLNNIQRLLGQTQTNEEQFNDIVDNTFQNKYYTICDLSRMFKVDRDTIALLESRGIIPQSEKDPKFNRIWLKSDIDNFDLQAALNKTF